MLEIKSLNKSFGGINIFKNLNFYLKKGERVGLTGGNGTGKSTLINLATGFPNIEVMTIQQIQRVP